MADIQISGLPDTSGLSSTDFLATKKGSDDLKATLQQVIDLVKDEITAEEILQKLLTVDTDTSGLNTNTLQGNTASFFTNASNLISGIVSNSRLPNGSYNENFVGGGAFGTGRNSIWWKIPSFLTGGTRLMVQFGYTNYISNNGQVLTTFPLSFSSGFGNENDPIVFVTPECRADGYAGVSDLLRDRDVELDIRLYYKDLTRFRCNAIRTTGSNSDYVRAMWLAIGKY